MRRNRRAPRRQGVVYGPPRAYDHAGEGSFVGRLLGPIVIVGAFALLAAGAWAFVGRGGPVGSASPTRGAIASASPSASPTPSPIATLPPSPTPTASLVPSPSPSPTEFAIEVQEGPGAITFGTQFDEQTLRIVDPQVSFDGGGRFFWSAQLTESAGAPELLITIHEYDAAADTETLVSEETWAVDNERAAIFLRRHRLQQLVDGPGIYVVRYLRGDILLAEGYFRVEPPEG